jgi:thymidylate kinase
VSIKTEAKAIVIAFEGIDGAGKSSIAARLYERLQGCAINVALVVTRGAATGPLVLPLRDGGYADAALSRLAALVWPRDNAESHDELGYRFWTGLVGAYFYGLEEGLLPQLRRQFDLVIVENWCFKYAAKIALKGQPAAVLAQSLPLEPAVDVVFLVDTPPEEAWRRGAQCGFSFVELGGQDGYAELGQGSFVDYQSRIRARLLEFAGEGWPRISNGGTVDDACREVEAVLLPMLRQRVTS